MTYKDALLTTLSQYTRLSYPWRCTRCLFCILYLYHFVSTGVKRHAYTNLYRVLFGSSTIGPKLLIKSLSRLSLQPLPWNNGWFYSAVSTFICYKHIGVYVCSMHACKVVCFMYFLYKSSFQREQEMSHHKWVAWLLDSTSTLPGLKTTCRAVHSCTAVAPPVLTFVP